jgi:hypothetical protein
MLAAGADTAQVVTGAVAVLSCVVSVVSARAALGAHRMTRNLESTRRRREYSSWAAALTPRLHRELGAPDDGLDPALRSTLVELLEAANAAWRDEQLDLVGTDWDGHREAFEEWMAHPRARAAWPRIRHRWQTGFREYVDGICAGAQGRTANE